MSNINPYRASGYEQSTWQMHQIFMRDEPMVMGVSHFVVPSVGDFITEKSGNKIIKYMVTNIVDSLYAEWIRVYEDMEDDGIEDLTVQDLSATAMVLVRNTISPHVAAIHIGLPIESDDFVEYAKLFIGTDIANLDAVVSLNLDNDGVPINDKIIINQDDINSKVYRAEMFHVDRIIEDKSRGTLVLYGADDIPIGKYTIIFRETDSIINFSKTELFITDLVLESAMLNPANPKEILVNKGFLNSTFNPRVFKYFNSKQREEISLTSRSLRLEGWGNYIFGEDNDTFPLSVQYTLASNEKSDLISDESGNIITSKYTIRVVDDDSAVNYKLYPTILYNRGLSRYEVKYYIYDTTFRTNVDVTDVIELSTEFNPLNYSSKQVFNFAVNLKLSGITPEEEYLRGSFAIHLFAAPMEATTPYRIHFVPSDDERYYGDKLRARISYEMGNHTLSVDSDYTQYEEWLDNVYYKLLPMYDSSTHDNAPEPTHVDVYIDGEMETVDILNQWNVGVRWRGSIPSGMHTAELTWYSYDSAGNRIYLARSTMQVEIV